MPITPNFSITQTPSHIELQISVPHVRVTPESVQVVITEDSVLHFSSSPYLLVLEFAPHAFHETANESCATYEPTIQNGVIRLKLKKSKAQHWDDLDLLGKLVRSKPAGTTRWLKEVTGEDDTAANDLHVASGIASDAPEEGAVPPNFAGYGFLRMFHGIFIDLARDGLAREMLEMPWEEQGLSASESDIRQERRENRLQVEEEKFCADRYLGDLEIQDDYIYQCAMAMEPHWNESSSSGNVDALTQQLSSLDIQEQLQSNQEAFFTSDERTQLMAIPYPLLAKSISPNQEHALCVGLLDILFAYAYDHVVTDGDPTVESSWSVTILSASLSWLEDWLPDGSVENVIQSSLRRAIIHPYIRNCDFGVFIWGQVAVILRRGVRCVLRCLLQTRLILERSDMYYLGNKLFLDPYLAWVQAHANTLSERLTVLAQEVESVIADESIKTRLGLDLVRIEKTAMEEAEADESSDSSDSDDDDDDDDDDSGSGGNDTDDSSDEKSASSSTDSADEPKVPHAEARATPQAGSVHSSELLDSNLGKSVLLGIASPPTVVSDIAVETRKEEAVPVKKSLIEEIG